MGRSWIYIAICTILILLIMLISIFLIEIITIVTLGNRVENSLIGAGWAGFSELDVEVMGERSLGVDDPEDRNITLNKQRAEAVVRQYIIENLKLDSMYYPTDFSYIKHRSSPVIIEEINIFNPIDLPAVLSNGTTITRTTIQIIVQIPIDVKGIGLVYARKNVLVDIDSFI